jgi:quercetin dioxygenase-like cupin family protein
VSSQGARASEVFSERITALAPEAGEARWWLGGLAVIKLTGKETEGRFSLIELLYPPKLEVPLHVHTREDELFHLLEGTISYRIGASRLDAAPGHTVFAPRNIPHNFTVTSAGPARYLIVYSPAGFEDCIRETSEPAQALTLPPNPYAPIPPAEIQRIATLMATKYGCQFVG